MSKSYHGRVNIVFLLAMVLTSAATMVWLFWHFPVATAIVTLTVVLGLSISTRLATSTDYDARAELEPDESGVGSH